jgi:arginyl-tRNA synthetase
MEDPKVKIYSILEKIAKEMGVDASKFSVERPKEAAHGDFSSNIAMTLAKNLKQNPLALAQEIVKKVGSSNLEFAKIEAVAPGFINFYLSKEYLSDCLREIENKKDEYGKGEGLKDKKIMVEFTDPNPFKEFHIGHLYTNIVGEAISRMLSANSAVVKRANYQGDVGMHVAKAIYGIQKEMNQHGEDLKAWEVKPLKVRIQFLGRGYSWGAKAYEEDKKVKKEIEQLNKKIYDKDEAIMDLYEKGRQWSLEYFETIYKRLGTKFDFYYFESEVGVDGLKLVKEYLQKGVFEESQGAVIFPGKKQNLHNRVFINSLGLPTYEAKELGLAFKKYNDFKYDQSIIITANEIIGYFKVLIAALGKINPDLASKTKHLSHGMVRLPIGKMSSRAGNIITGEWLLDEAKKLLKSKYSDMTEVALEEVAVGAIKYALLKSSLGHDIEFNFEESISIQGDSGPYMQYTFARTQSVWQKSNQKTDFKDIENLNPEELSLLRTVAQFGEVVENAAIAYSPNVLCNYLFDLAQKFNFFYQKYKIIGSDRENFRLALTLGVGQVIKNGLNLLGISAPEHM